MTFVLESNLLLFQFICWKVLQVGLGYNNLITFNYSSLISTLLVISIINMAKTYWLFDYEIVQIINNFTENHQKLDEQKDKPTMQMSQSVDVFIKQDGLDEIKEVDESSSKLETLSAEQFSQEESNRY